MNRQRNFQIGGRFPRQRRFCRSGCRSPSTGWCSGHGFLERESEIKELGSSVSFVVDRQGIFSKGFHSKHVPFKEAVQFLLGVYAESRMGLGALDDGASTGGEPTEAFRLVQSSYRPRRWI